MAKSRAQSAMEFLMTYGWALLIIVIVIAVLFYIGVLNPKGASGNSCIFAPGTSCYTFKLASDSGGLVLDIGQATGKPILVTGIGCSQNEVLAQNVTTLSSDITVPPGDHKWIVGGDSNNSLNCTDANGSSLNSANAVAGERYKGKVCIAYTELGAPQTDRMICGDITARFEPVSASELGGGGGGGGGLLSFGAACTNGSQCITGYCSGGFCAWPPVGGSDYGLYGTVTGSGGISGAAISVWPGFVAPAPPENEPGASLSIAHFSQALGANTSNSDGSYVVYFAGGSSAGPDRASLLPGMGVRFTIEKAGYQTYASPNFSITQGVLYNAGPRALPTPTPTPTPTPSPTPTPKPYGASCSSNPECLTNYCSTTCQWSPPTGGNGGVDGLVKDGAGNPISGATINCGLLNAPHEPGASLSTADIQLGGGGGCGSYPSTNSDGSFIIYYAPSTGKMLSVSKTGYNAINSGSFNFVADTITHMGVLTLLKPNGQVCTTNSQCNSNACIASYAGPKYCCSLDGATYCCASSSDCNTGAGEVCVNNWCVPGKANGELCSGNSECQSNYCQASYGGANHYCCTSPAYPCCAATGDCNMGAGDICSDYPNYWCRKVNGQACDYSNNCQTDYCAYNYQNTQKYCCASGTCCASNSDCNYPTDECTSSSCVPVPSPTPTPVTCPSGGGTITACPCTISDSGFTYHIYSSLPAYSGTCITITGTSTTLDCHNNKITGKSYVGDGIFLSTAAGILVQNCIVQTFQSGIHLLSTNGVTLTGNVFCENINNFNCGSSTAGGSGNTCGPLDGPLCGGITCIGCPAN